MAFCERLHPQQRQETLVRPSPRLFRDATAPPASAPMPSNLEILAYEHTELGPLCLRRRSLLSRPDSMVTEITLGHELLMSSRYTVSEERLAEAALEMHAGSGLHVLVGGLGLGYTARAALASSRVASVHALELLPQVIDWVERGLVPLASLLREDDRLRLSEGDAYAVLRGPPSTRYDVILVDVDHAPDNRLQEVDDGFYTAEGLRRARRHLAPEGVLGVWSSAESTDFTGLLRKVFDEVKVEGVTFFNDLVGVERTDWLFLAS